MDHIQGIVYNKGKVFPIHQPKVGIYLSINTPKTNLQTLGEVYNIRNVEFVHFLFPRSMGFQCT